jgi:hypothetical protein
MHLLVYYLQFLCLPQRRMGRRVGIRILRREARHRIGRICAVASILVPHRVESALCLSAAQNCPRRLLRAHFDLRYHHTMRVVRSLRVKNDKFLDESSSPGMLRNMIPMATTITPLRNSNMSTLWRDMPIMASTRKL